MAIAATRIPSAFARSANVGAELGVAQHILRYWEPKFPQLRPLQRAGNRRYYRPADVALARRIHRLLGDRGLYRARRPEAASRRRRADAEPAPAILRPAGRRQPAADCRQAPPQSFDTGD